MTKKSLVVVMSKPVFIKVTMTKETARKLATAVKDTIVKFLQKLNSRKGGNNGKGT